MTQTQIPPAPTAAKPVRRRKVKPSCASCYFGARGLCALGLAEPCSTYRPDNPRGLMPPAQPMLLVRSEPSPLAATPLGAESGALAEAA